MPNTGKSSLQSLQEKWLDHYDKALLYFYTVVVAVLAFIAKDHANDSYFSSSFGTGTFGSYVILLGTLLFASYLLWLNYVSIALFVTNLALAKSDSAFLDFLRDTDRVQANKIYVVFGHAVLFSPPLCALLWYAKLDWADLFKDKFFSVFTFICFFLYVWALFMRIYSLIRIGRRFEEAVKQILAEQKTTPPQ